MPTKVKYQILQDAGDLIRTTVQDGGGDIVYTNIAKRLVELARGERK